MIKYFLSLSLLPAFSIWSMEGPVTNASAFFRLSEDTPKLVGFTLESAHNHFQLRFQEISPKHQLTLNTALKSMDPANQSEITIISQANFNVFDNLFKCFETSPPSYEDLINDIKPLENCHKLTNELLEFAQKQSGNTNHDVDSLFGNVGTTRKKPYRQQLRNAKSNDTWNNNHTQNASPNFKLLNFIKKYAPHFFILALLLAGAFYYFTGEKITEEKTIDNN